MKLFPYMRERFKVISEGGLYFVATVKSDILVCETKTRKEAQAICREHNKNIKQKER